MMLHTEMNALLAGFGPTTSLAAEHQLFKRQNSFENEVESIYFSEDLKKQDLDASRSVTASSLAGSTSLLASSLNLDYDDSMAFAVAKPEDVTGQMLAVKMEDTEEDIIEANFDLSQLLEEDQGVQMEEEDCSRATEAEGQQVINEMHEFLGQFQEEAESPSFVSLTGTQPSVVEESALPECLAEELLSMEARHTLNTMDTKFPVLNENDMTQAEELLDMLLADSSPVQQQPAQQQTDILQEAMVSQNLHDSGFIEEDIVVPEETVATTVAPKTYNVSNVTQFQMPDGKKVIIVIQPASTTGSVAQPAVTKPAVMQPAVMQLANNQLLPAAVSHDSDVVEDSDSDWDPDVAATSTGNRKKPGRKPAVRAAVPVTEDGKVTKRSYRAIKDKKQRKMLQNVEAARRYRDKKKQEQADVEEEEKLLMKRNKELKDQLSDIESEFKTMKKLMGELGLIKFVSKRK